MRVEHRNRNRERERGAITIHVALALIAILAFSSFSIDHGLMWVSRRQAQNAADAGALAGAISLISDGGTTPVAKVAAQKFAEINAIFGDANAGNVQVDVSGTAAGETSILPCGTENGCIRVDIMRGVPGRAGGAAVGTPLPTFFAKIVGIGSQGVRATATARVVPGNATDCLRPFAIPDLAGTGYTLAADLGTELVLTVDSDTLRTPGSFRMLDLLGGGATTDRTIRACTNEVYGVGDDLAVYLKPEGTLAADSTLFEAAIGALITYTDPTAAWDPGTRTIVNSCVEPHTCHRYDATGYAVLEDPYAAVSPRVIALPVFDPTTPPDVVRIVNIVGFFVDGFATGPGGSEIRGYLVKLPGRFVAASGTVPKTSSFLNVPWLVR